MEDSSSNRINTDNSIASKETAINTSPNFEVNIPISPYMQKQIIKSIAQNLKDIIKENIHNNQMKYVKHDIFYISRLPPISLEDYINRIFKNTKMNISSLILSIIYIDRFCENNGYILSLKNIHRIFLTACRLSIKFNEDINVSTKYYSNVAGITVQDLNNLEFYLIVSLEFSLFVENDIYQKYFEYFCKFNTNDNKKTENDNIKTKFKSNK
jgi:hypothetical protein